MAKRHSPKQIERYAYKLRERPVKHERLFRQRLDAAGIVYEFQVRVGFYIADFIVPSKMLIVELDGPLHDADHDAKRDAFLAMAGFTVWRIPNADSIAWPIEQVTTFVSSSTTTYRNAIRWANNQHKSAMGIIIDVSKNRPRGAKYFSGLRVKTETAQQRENLRREGLTKPKKAIAIVKSYNR